MPHIRRSHSWPLFLILLGSCVPAPHGAPSKSAISTPPAVSPTLPPAPIVAHADKQRGLSWVGGPPIVPADLDTVKAVHADWIVQTPFGWQQQYNDPHLHLNTTNNHSYWGESDEGLKVTTRMANEAGIKTLLKPHIWLRRTPDGKWRSEIAMDSEEDWQTWFEHYTGFALHYAAMAESLDIPTFCIGTELRATVVVREADWRKLIAQIRTVYRGKLTYAANWYKEYEEVPFWDDLDYIGVQAYFPLVKTKDPSHQQLRQGWRPHLASLETVSRREGKPILFTEVGYRSSDDCAIEPWLWPRQEGAGKIVSLETQARCYQVMFEALWDQPWFAGAYIWKWFPKHQSSGGKQHYGFTPQNKPAQDVLSTWYSKGQTKPH